MSAQMMSHADGTRSRMVRIVAGMVGLVVGLKSTLRAMFEPKITVSYPLQKVNVSPRWHGLLALPIDPETANDKRIIRFQCETACPDRCIHIRETGMAKDRLVPRFDIEQDKSCYCGSCLE